MLQKLFKWTQGRHTAFAVYFALVGTALQWFHRLDPNFIMLIASVQAFVLGHSVKESYFDSKNQTPPEAPQPTPLPASEGLNPSGPKNF